MKKCMGLGDQGKLNARTLFQEHQKYEELQKNQPEEAVAQIPPRKPEDTNPLYRVLATPVDPFWVLVADRAGEATPNNTPAFDLEVEEYHVLWRNTTRRRKRRSVCRQEPLSSHVNVEEDQEAADMDVPFEDEYVDVNAQEQTSRSKKLLVPNK